MLALLRLELIKFLNILPWSDLGCQRFSNRIICHTCLFHTPVAYGIKKYSEKSNNKRGITYNTIRKSLAAKITPREDIQKLDQFKT